MTSTIRRHRDRPRERGFTLIELLVVITVLGLLIAILLPSFSRARGQANSTATAARIAGLSTACETFRDDHQRYPGQSSAFLTEIENDNITGVQALAIELFGLDPVSLEFDPNNTTYAEPGQFLVSYYDRGGDERDAVLVDNFSDGKVHEDNLGKGLGMPLLYYPARRNAAPLDIYVQADNSEFLRSAGDNVSLNTYDGDNSALAEALQDVRFTDTPSDPNNYRPYRPDSFVLIGAGLDREYFTDDDNTNYK